MEGICGANCLACEVFKSHQCSGCRETKGCPFGKKCWIAHYIEIGGMDSFWELKRQLISEFQSLAIDGMGKIDDLYPLHGAFVNLEYPLPNGETTKFLLDDEAYLGTQIECQFGDSEFKKCYGLLANMSFLLVCEYGENGENPEIIIYKKR